MIIVAALQFREKKKWSETEGNLLASAVSNWVCSVPDTGDFSFVRSEWLNTCTLRLPPEQRESIFPHPSEEGAAKRKFFFVPFKIW